MTLCRMQVTDFRCLHQVDFELDSSFTLISGPNASGKTSLLEAIYMLGRGRSFRTRRLEPLIRSGADRFIVFGTTEAAGRSVPIGVEGSADGLRAKVGASRVETLADLSAALPVQVIDPEIHRLIEEGPARRRRYLDWGVFHVEPSFVSQWQKYHLVLRQRNAALRAAGSRSVVSAWDGDLIRYATSLTEARRRYVDMLNPIAADVARRLVGLDLDLSYRPGWNRELDFARALELSWRHDHESAATQVGPQRAELLVRLGGIPARDRISRGQQKLVAAVLLIAQIKLLEGSAAARPVLLLDDPAAELDAQRLQAFIEEVRAQPLQLVVSTLNQDSEQLDAFGRPGRRYRIERGAVTPV